MGSEVAGQSLGKELKMHNIGYNTYDENVNRKKVMADIIEEAEENGDGYSSRFTWHDEVPPLETYEDAKKFIKGKDNGWYDDHAVRFKDYTAAKKTAKIEEYEKKIAELGQERNAYREKHSVHTFQAKYVGCAKCGSKLSKEHLRGEVCPLCGTDLRSKTTLDKMEWYADKIADYRKRIEAEKMKQKKSVKIKWLVKYEYHS